MSCNMLPIHTVFDSGSQNRLHIKIPYFPKYKRGTQAMVRKLELLDQIPLVPEMKMK